LSRSLIGAWCLCDQCIELFDLAILQIFAANGTKHRVVVASLVRHNG